MSDVVVSRKDIPTAYHVSVVVDDALQGVNVATRGQDLYFATPLHRLLQTLLGLPRPDYHHHRLITGEDGKRLSKSAHSMPLQQLREAGKSRDMVLKLLGLE